MALFGDLHNPSGDRTRTQALSITMLTQRSFGFPPLPSNPNSTSQERKSLRCFLTIRNNIPPQLRSNPFRAGDTQKISSWSTGRVSCPDIHPYHRTCCAANSPRTADTNEHQKQSKQQLCVQTGPHFHPLTKRSPGIETG